MATKNGINNKAGELTIDPGASGDSFIQFDINATNEYRIGVDDDDSNKFKFSQGSALGTNDLLTITTDGQNVMPLQPAFSSQGSGALDITGDGSVHTMVWGGDQLFDQNSDFDGISTFTAPVSGKFFLSATVITNDYSSGHTEAIITLSTSNRDYVSYYVNPYGASGTQSLSLDIAHIVDMDASDTAVIKVAVSNGTKTVAINGFFSYFCGYLAG